MYSVGPVRESGSVLMFSRDDGKNQRRRMRLVVINHVGGFDHARGAGLFFARIHVSVEAREIAAGDFQPQLMPRQEHIAGSP